MEFMDVIRNRRSIRKYTDEPVSDADLDYVLEAARLAPSWANTQCWRFIVVKNPEMKTKLAEAGNAWIAHAPVIVVACADPSKPGTKGDQEYYMLDVGIAMEHLVLAAADRGLGTCWIGAFDEQTVKTVLDVPDGIRVVATTPLGHPAESPDARSRKTMDEIVCSERYG